MTIQVEKIGQVVLVRLNRPEALNALNSEVLKELVETMQPMDQDPNVGCFVLTGSEKAFAAGADIKEMSEQTYQSMFASDFFAGWEAFTKLRTPIIGAVNGYALGGGCELAMMCDMIFAGDTAHFGQPEIKLGVIPGMGGSQRLTRLVGKAMAMDMILTGRMIDAQEAKQFGLVSRIIPKEQLVEQAMEVAATIAEYSKPSAMLAKEVVNRAEQTSLDEGLLYERRVFHALFATDDQKEGMRAFIAKEKPDFTGR